MRTTFICPAAGSIALLLTSIAAAADVQIILSAAPAPHPLQTYPPGQTVPVSISLRSTGAAITDVGIVQIDFSQCTAGLVNPASFVIDAALATGVITTAGGGQVVRWSFTGVPGSSPLNIPADPGSIVFGTFNAVTPITPGLAVGVNVLGPSVGDGGITGALIVDGFNAVWENGDVATESNIVGGVLALTTFANHPPAKVIFSTIGSDASSLAPAGAGLPAGERLTSIGRPSGSPDGSRWIVPAVTNGPANASDLIIVGSSDNSSTAATTVREGSPATWAPGPPMQTVGPITRPRMGILNNGHFVFSGSTTAGNPNDHIVKFDGVSFISVAREGLPVPGTPDELFGSDLHSAHLLADGTPCFLALQTIGSAGNQVDDYCLRGDLIALQQGSVPPGQLVDPPVPLVTFSANDFRHDASGSSWILDASLVGTVTNQVILLNGTVVLQEGALLPGSDFISPMGTTGGEQPQMMADGTWFVRGENADGQDWIVRDGIVIARTDDLVGPASQERFADDAAFPTCFDFMQGSPDVGGGRRWVIGGRTDNPVNPDPATGALFNRVVVSDDGTVVLRTGDGVDLNGNGLVDDNCFVTSVRPDAGFLRADPLDPQAAQLVMVVEVCNGSGVVIGIAMISVNVPPAERQPPPCPADIAPPAPPGSGSGAGNGVVNVDDLLAVINTWAQAGNVQGDVTGNGIVNVDDLLAVINAWGPCG